MGFLHSSGKQTEIFQKMNYCNTTKFLRKQTNKQKYIENTSRNHVSGANVLPLINGNTEKTVSTFLTAFVNYF